MSDQEKRIPLAVPCIGGRASEYLGQCLATNFVSSVGPFVSRFEEEFAAYVGTRFAVACASGTAAIHVAMRVLGVGRDDDVLVPTLTFIASANPIVYENARCVFVDAEQASWNIDPDLVVEELERRHRIGQRQPRAVQVVHILGHPAQIEPIAAACERFGVALVEDAAEALGARYATGALAGKHVGTIGRVGCYSFNGNKIVTTGGGGMLVTDDENIARRARHLTTQARLPGSDYRHDEIGYNYRLTNLAAALGVAQLEQLPSLLDSKRAIARTYDRDLAEIHGIELPPSAPWAHSSRWLYSVLIDPNRFGCDRRALESSLARQQIESRPIWSPLHTMPMYADAKRLGGGVAEALHASGLSLPCSAGLAPEDQRRVIQAVREVSRARRTECGGSC